MPRIEHFGCKPPSVGKVCSNKRRLHRARSRNCGHASKASAVLRAFDLLELDGEDLRRQPIEKRKELLAKLLKGSHLSIILNEHFKEDGAIAYREACRLGCEGIVSRRIGSLYRSGRSPHWVKVKNPNAPAVKREAEEDWR
jgi:bifunctional non-homologous end joining protein LigD